MSIKNTFLLSLLIATTSPTFVSAAQGGKAAHLSTPIEHSDDGMGFDVGDDYHINSRDENGLTSLDWMYNNLKNTQSPNEIAGIQEMIKEVRDNHGAKTSAELDAEAKLNAEKSKS